MCHPRQEFSLKFAILLEISLSSYITALGVQLPSVWSLTTYPARSYILPDRQPCADISPENACYKQWASQQPTYYKLESGNEEAWDSELHVDITSPNFAIIILSKDNVYIE